MHKCLQLSCVIALLAVAGCDSDNTIFGPHLDPSGEYTLESSLATGTCGVIPDSDRLVGDDPSLQTGVLGPATASVERNGDVVRIVQSPLLAGTPNRPQPCVTLIEGLLVDDTIAFEERIPWSTPDFGNVGFQCTGVVELSVVLRFTANGFEGTTTSRVVPDPGCPDATPCETERVWRATRCTDCEPVICPNNRNPGIVSGGSTGVVVQP